MQPEPRLDNLIPTARRWQTGRAYFLTFSM